MRPWKRAKPVSTIAPSESVATRMLNGGISSSAIRIVTQVVPQPRQSTTRSRRALAVSERLLVCGSIRSALWDVRPMRPGAQS